MSQKPKSSNSQNARILEALQNGDEISTFEAFARFKCVRLGSRVFDLRHGKWDGNEYNIKEKIMRTDNGDSYSVYYRDKDEPILNAGQIGLFKKKAS